MQMLAFNLHTYIYGNEHQYSSQNYKEVHDRKEIWRMGRRIVEGHIKAENY